MQTKLVTLATAYMGLSLSHSPSLDCAGLSLIVISVVSGNQDQRAGLADQYSEREEPYNLSFGESEQDLYMLILPMSLQGQRHPLTLYYACCQRH